MPVISATVERVLRHHMADSPGARAAARELEGAVLLLELRELPLAFRLVVEDGELCVDGVPADEAEADAHILTHLPGLVLLATAEARGAMARGQLEIRGDAVVAQRYSQLLRSAAPDLEEALSELVGDVAAHRLGRLIRGFGKGLRRTSRTLADDLVEYLQEESRDLVGRHEMDDFLEQVDTLRDDTDRSEARLVRAERRARSGVRA